MIDFMYLTKTETDPIQEIQKALIIYTVKVRIAPSYQAVHTKIKKVLTLIRNVTF